MPLECRLTIKSDPLSRKVTWTLWLFSPNKARSDQYLSSVWAYGTVGSAIASAKRTAKRVGWTIIGEPKDYTEE